MRLTIGMFYLSGREEPISLLSPRLVWSGVERVGERERQGEGEREISDELCDL